MRNYLKAIFTISLIMALLTGCVTTGTTTSDATGNPCKSPVDQSKLKKQGAALLAAGGALGGALLGQLIGGDTKSTLIGAGVGAALGGIVGNEWGKTIAERKEQYQSEECRLNGEIDVVVNQNQQIRNINNQNKIVIEKLQKDIADLKRRSLSGEDLVNELKLVKAKIETKIKESTKHRNDMNTEMIALSQYHESILETQNQEKIKKLEEEIGALKLGIANIDENNQQMAEMVASL